MEQLKKLKIVQNDVKEIKQEILTKKEVRKMIDESVDEVNEQV